MNTPCANRVMVPLSLLIVLVATTADAQQPSSFSFFGQEVPGFGEVMRQAADALQLAESSDADKEPADAASGAIAAERPLAPEVIVHISEDLLRTFIDREVNQVGMVQDVVLGTPVHGNSFTQGVTTLDLTSNEREATFEIRLVGTSSSNTQGRSGPAHIYSRGQTQFAASKRVILDDQGFRALPAVVSVHAESQPYAIASELPGLPGRIVRRVAWRRLDEQRTQINAESARLAHGRILGMFDSAVNQQVERLNQGLALRSLLLDILVDDESWSFRFSTTDRHLRLVASRAPEHLESPETPAPLASAAPLEIRVQGELLRSQLQGLLGQAEPPSLISQTPLADVLMASTLNRVIGNTSLPIDVSSDTHWIVFSWRSVAANERNYSTSYSDVSR